MSDTPRDVQVRFRQMLLTRGPAERLRMCTGMFGAAKALALAGIRGRVGPIPDRRLRGQLFLLFYGSGFTEAERRAILQRVEANVPPSASLPHP